MPVRSHRSRRAVWKRSRLVGYPLHIAKWIPKCIDYAWKAIGAIVHLLVIVVLIYSFYELRRDLIIIEPISVPKQYAEGGITPEVMADRIKDAISEMEGSTTSTGTTGTHKDLVALSSEVSSVPHIEVPGAGLDLTSAIEIARRIIPFSKNPKKISGEITLSAAPVNSAVTDLAPRYELESTVQITLRITGTDGSSVVSERANDSTKVVSLAAKRVLRQINPYMLAVYFYSTRDFDSADALAWAIIRDPSQDKRHRSAAQELLGLVLDEQHKYDEAITKYQEAIKIDSMYASPHDSLGWVLYEQRKYDEAITECRNAIKIDSKYAWAYNTCGEALNGQTNREAAIAMYQKAIEIDPKFKWPYTGWGWVLYEEQKYDQAIAEYQRAIDLDPKLAWAYWQWGKLLDTEHKYNEGLAKYQKAIELDPHFPWPYVGWGSLLYEQKKNKKNYDQAIAMYQKAIELDPRFAWAYENWGWLLYEQGNYDQAIAMYQRAIGLDPSFAEAYNDWGWLLYEQRNDDQAIAMYQRAIKLDPWFAGAYNNWGRLLYEQGNYDQAIAMYQRAIELDPWFAVTYDNWGLALEKLGHSAEAAEKFATSRKLQ